MALTKFNKNINYHQSQPDQPTQSADEIKKLFDQAGIDIKDYINTILTEELDKLIESKVDKIQNKGLSEEDFTTEYKNKLNGIEENANKYTLPIATGSVLGGVKTGANITNTNGLISLIKDNIIKALGYTPPTKDTTYGVASTTANGLMSYSDKNKLNGIPDGNTLNNKFNGKAPTNHANASSTYGLGTRSVYGHVKITNNLLASAYTDGEVLSAYQGYVLNQKIVNLENKIKELQAKVNNLERMIK